MKSKEKRAKKNTLKTANTPVPMGAPPHVTSFRGWFVILFLALAAAGGTWALVEYVIWSRVPPELVGKWVVMEGPDEGGTVDFFCNGTMVAKVNLKGKEGIIEAKVRVKDKKRIYVTTTHEATGEQG